MSIHIRPAVHEDFEDFFRVWRTYLSELSALGSDRDDGSGSEKMHQGLFAEYTSGRIPGVALLAVDDGEIVGAALWGCMSGGGLLPSMDAVAYGWGVYVIPERRQNGISTALRERAILELDSIGVLHCVGVVMLSNGPGVESSRSNGFVPTELIATMDLREQADRIRYGSAEHKKFYWKGHCPLCGGEGK